MKLDEQFVNYVMKFCDKRKINVETLALRANYTNREKIFDVFIMKKGSIGLPVAGRMLAEMKRIDPSLRKVTFEFDPIVSRK